MLDEIRQRVLDDHASLRQAMETLNHLIRQSSTGRSGPTAELVAAARAFVRHVAAHLDYEDDVLIPALLESTNWGKVNTRDVVRFHSEQHARLARLDPLLDEQDVGLPQFLAALRSVMELVSEDMAHEERDILVPRMLRDDPVGIDVTDG
ncbi:MAG: hemerythrin domain-containing protein [Myxococcota bacterium]